MAKQLFASLMLCYPCLSQNVKRIRIKEDRENHIVVSK